MRKSTGILLAVYSGVSFLACLAPAYGAAHAPGSAATAAPLEVGAASPVSPHRNGIAASLRAFVVARTAIQATSGGGYSRQTKELPGQTSTLLPDGRVLLTGGEQSNKPVSAAYIKDPILGTATALGAGLNVARYGHTATVLPNGSVLILGGIGLDGKIVGGAEIFDPSTQQFTAIPTQELAPRAFHTSTLLTDGRVLVAGGLSTSGQITGKLEYWDYRSGTVTPASVGLQTPRGALTAVLQADGTVLFWGGVDANGTALNSGEVFDAETGQIQSRSDLPPSTSSQVPSLAASLPIDGAQNVALTTVIALRFNKPLRVGTINQNTVTLTGPSGKVGIQVVAAESGMLAFITPQSSLLPASQYELSVFDATDPSGTVLPGTVVRFTTAGTSSPAVAPLPIVQPNPFNSPARKLPPLQAPKGVTAISGQVLQLDGNPLPNTTLQIGNLSVRSDKTGRFLLENVPSGHQVMWIDGTTANNQGMTYGIFQDGVNVVASQTNVLAYTIWMTVLDTADEVTVPSPTERETIVSTPVLPGLELHIPKGTVIQDRNGNTVTKVGITLIPVSQPPFPLPAGVNVPTYFTIQPGGATLQGYWGGSYWSVGARLFYPNAEKLPPNSPFDFWNYDAADKGWYVYGQGRVTADGKEVVPNPGVEIYGFSGAMVGNPPYPTPGPCCNGGGGGGGGGGNGNGGDPVDLQTGLFVYTKTDLALSDVIPIELTRTYRQLDPTSHAFGIGTMSNYDIYLIGDGNSYSNISLVLANGGQVEFDRTSSGTGYQNAAYQSTSGPGTYYGAQIVWNGSSWTMTLKNGTKMLFPESSGANYYLQAALTGVVDRYGNTLTLTRDANHNLTRVTSPSGRWIQYSYDSSNRVTQASDSLGRNVYYTYDSSGRLYTVQDANNGTTTFTYDSNNNMQTIKDARGIVYLTNYYDANNMVSKQVMVDGSTYKFSYVLNGGQISANGASLPANTASQVMVTDPRGIVRTVNFNPDGYMTSETNAVGLPEQQTITYNREPESGLLLSKTDALNRTTSYTYDSMGNVTSVMALSGTTSATTTAFGYNQFGELTNVTDALGRVTSVSYDNAGNPVGFTGTDGNSASFTYNTIGQPVSFTDPSGNLTQLSYSGPDVTGVIDPLHRQTGKFTDSAGRIGAISNSQGQSVQAAFNPLNQVTSVTDSLGGVTSMVYDPNGNLTSLTDARNSLNPTQFTYDNMDRLQTRTDPLGNPESYVYDGDGNLTQFTDRRGKVTTYQYDGLNRLTFVGFGTQAGPIYESTISYTWDAGNRLTQIADSIAGTTTIGYDSLNRLTSVGSPQGSVSYTYDAVGRRKTMTVAGQPEVDYTYDSGNRVTQIAQGSSTVQIGYDADGRRTSLTLPNGIVAKYSYDAGSELTGITYTQSGATLGDLEYTYDGVGRVASMSGSLAHTSLPQPLSNSNYNAANQLAQFGTAQLTYDANGNLTNDGTHSYTWDARNHLVAIDGGNTASFVYDAFGRRISKSVYGVTTGYLYDGPNVVQELSGTTPSANLLSGGLDEVFTRTDSSGTANFLRDGLGSTSALTDSTGAIQLQYTYEPYGNGSTTGNSSSNSYQYLGRETDATGLYYFRNRYYNPITQSFLSADPMGLAGGPNLYQYGAGNPTTYRDPNGKFIEGCASGALAYEVDQVIRGLSGRKMDSGWRFLRGIGTACGVGIFTEGFGAWAGALSDALEGLGPEAMEAEEAAAGAEAAAAPCGACFPPGTPVETRHGHVPIEKIKTGDEVLARDMSTGKLEYKTVVALTRPHKDHLLELKIEGERAAIEATPSHPFWVKRAGAAAAWITVGKMQPGDRVLTEKGKWEKVAEDTSLNKLATVYNFEVQDDHDYFVGTEGLLVHNEGPCGINWPPDHGFALGTREGTTLEPGTTIDRYGNPNGDMTAPAGTPFSERALPSNYQNAPLTTFEVQQPFQVTQGLTEPWFGQEGTGIQYEMPFNTLDMVEMGFLKIIP